MLFLEKINKILFKKKIKTRKEIENENNLKTIVEIPLKTNKISELIENENEKTPTFRAFQKMVTNIQFLCVNKNADKKIILITSAEPETGKSYITANLAIAFSKIGKKVLIIDADMINGRQSEIFNIPSNLGLSNYLSNLDTNGVEINEFLSKFINETAIKNVNIITSGTIPPNPSELLASDRLSELIKDAKVFFDVILIDSSEVLEKAETIKLAKYATFVILVAEARKTTIEKINSAKNEIEKASGKILGIALNGIRLPKTRKTKEQRKEEFTHFRLKLKEKIDNTIENIKRKISQINQKLLEEPKEKELEEITLKETESKEIKKIEKNIEEANNEIIEEVNIDTKISVLDKIKTKANEAKNKITKFAQNEKKNFNNSKNEIEEKNFVANEILAKIEEEYREEIKEEIKEENREIYKEENIEENVEEKNDRKTQINLKFENAKLAVKTKFSGLKEASNEKIKCIKDKLKDIKLEKKDQKEIKEEQNDEKTVLKEEMILEKQNSKLEEIKTEKTKEDLKADFENDIPKVKVKDKILNTSRKFKNVCVNRIDSLKNKFKEKTVEKEADTNTTTEKVSKNENNIKNEDMILVMVDAENGYCRVLSKEYFVEKLIRGIDKKVGTVKTHYSMRNLRRKRQYFIERYQITEKQTNRIDVLIYDALKDYDEYQWIERKIPSDKAENYAFAIAKEFEKEPEETEKEYIARCQRLRKKELENAELDIEYKLDNLWITSKINLLDKILLNRFAKIYEVETNMKNDSEIMKSKKIKKFYTEIIKGAEKRFEKAKKEDIKREEKEKEVVEEDRKIKQEELKYEQQQLEIERKAAQERIKIEHENVKAEKRAEQERLKEEKRKEREIEKIEKKEEMSRKRREKQKLREEAKFQKERERLKQIEEAKIEEELLEDNLYPKTKHNKNL